MPSDSVERRPPRQQQNPVQEQDHLRCPRCDSTNTKFCYYNNYNLSQPRHFCKSCRRYWTKGGTLRNIPVGGGSRKNTKRSRTSSAPQDPLSAVPISASPPSEPDISVSLRDECAGVTGGFTSLLATSSPGYLALGESFLHRGFGLGLGSGTGSGFDEEMGFGLGRAVWPLAEVGEAGGNTWQLVNGEGFGDGDCFAWPDLAISTTPAKGLQ